MLKKLLAAVLTSCVALVLGSTTIQADVIYYHDFNLSGTLYSIDTDVGVENVVGNTGLTDSWGMAFAPDGTLYGYHRADQSLYIIDINDASTTLVGVSGLGGTEALAVDASGTIVINSGLNMYSLSAADGSPTLIGTITGATHVPDGLSYSPVDLTVSGIGVVPAGSLFSVDSGRLYVMDPVTFASTFVGSTAGSETLAFGPDGTLYVHNFSNQFLTYDLTTLTSTPLAATSPNIVASAVEQLIEVSIDIKFCSDPNAFNCKKNGVLPVTIFGTAGFDVADIDVDSLRLCLADDLSACTGAPRDSSINDRGDPLTDLGAAQCAVVEVDEDVFVEMDYLNPDGYDDLDAAFEASEVQDLLESFCLADKGTVSASLVITGATVSGTPIFSVPLDDVGIDRLLKQNK